MASLPVSKNLSSSGASLVQLKKQQWRGKSPGALCYSMLDQSRGSNAWTGLLLKGTAKAQSSKDSPYLWCYYHPWCDWQTSLLLCWVGNSRDVCVFTLPQSWIWHRLYVCGNQTDHVSWQLDLFFVNLRKDAGFTSGLGRAKITKEAIESVLDIAPKGNHFLILLGIIYRTMYAQHYCNIPS